MFTFIKKKLELKIIMAVTVVIGCMIGIFAYVDIRDVRLDSIRTSERTLGAFAEAIKGSVVASMKKGHHEDVRMVLKEVNTPYFIERVMIYDETGRPRDGIEKLHDQGGLDMSLPPGVFDSVVNGDLTDVTKQGDGHFISYYSPIRNRKECVRCHYKNPRLNGILRVDFSLRDLDDIVIGRRNRVLIRSVLLIVLMTLVLVALMRRVIYRPVKELRDAMVNVREGLPPLALSTTGEDELADLKKSFVSMLDRINGLHRTNLEKEKEIARNQEEMRFREELRTMFDAMPDGVLLVDRDLKIIQSNPRFYALVPPVEPVGGQIKPDCLRKDCCPFQGIERALKDGTIIETQCTFTMPGKEARNLHSICAPIVEVGRVEYIVVVIRDITERIRTERELEERTAQLIAANRLLSQIAATDSLTQVHTRRYFDEILNKEIKRFNRRKYSHLSLMMIDIDHFKQLNDRYGHLAGDTVLREMGAALRESVRETDTVARYGGEEFAVIMPDTLLEGAKYRAEALRNKIETNTFPGMDQPITATISIGVATYVAGPAENLVRLADEALYQAKKSGRNKVVVSPLETVDKE